MNVLETDYWCLLLPQEWSAEQEDEVVTIVDSDDVGGRGGVVERRHERLEHPPQGLSMQRTAPPVVCSAARSPPGPAMAESLFIV